MKKITVLLLTALLALATVIAGCGSKETPAPAGQEKRR